MTKLLITLIATLVVALGLVSATATVRLPAAADAIAAGGYSQAHVLQPGSRGSVVEI